MKFIQAADIHLGVKPDLGKGGSEKRAREIWESFSEVIKIAEQEKPDFLFLPGDLFHSQPLKKELKEVNYLFGKIPDTKVILMAGNHDYIQQKSYYLTYEWNENVFFFDREEIKCFDFPEENVCIYGLSYWHKEIRESVYDTVIPENPGRINILLAHGGDETHIPFHPAKILANGFDYIAAGHIHKGGQLVENAAVMAGSLEPTNCNDTGAHGYWKGKIEKGNCQVSFKSIKRCEFCHEKILVTPETTEQQLLDEIRTLLEERPIYQYFRIFIEGYAEPDSTFDLEQVLEWERIVDITKNLIPDYNYEKLQAENANSLLGLYIDSMKKQPQNRVAAKALEYGVNALLGHKICR